MLKLKSQNDSHSAEQPGTVSLRAKFRAAAFRALGNLTGIDYCVCGKCVGDHENSEVPCHCEGCKH